MSFKGKTVVITGGANGIGRCAVEEFAKAGADVVFIDPDREAGIKVSEKFSDTLFIEGDISEQLTIESFSRTVIQKYGHIDILVNNAAVSRKGILSGCSCDDFNYVLRLGVTAPYMLTLQFKEHFTQGASVVNITSTRAYMSQADTESYSAAKGGVSALTHALSISLAGKVRVNSIAPGWIDTSAYHDKMKPLAVSHADKAQHPAGRIGVPLDIVKVIMYLSSEDASFITGENIIVDGGMSRLMIYHNDNGWHYDA